MQAEWPPRRSAARASARAFAAECLLGALGIAALALVLARLLAEWRVSPHVASHRVAVLGQKLSYPAASAGAVIVLALALLGAIVMAAALRAIAHEHRGARRLARQLVELHPVRHGGVFVILNPRPDAFCAGFLRPRVYVTSGALALLDEPALRAVLAHERHHAQRRDPLRLATTRVIARSLFFVPGLRAFVWGQQLLAELSADEGAIRTAAGDQSGLAQAMLTFSEVEGAGPFSTVDPARVDYLLGEPPAWRFPALTCIVGIGLVAVVATAAILAGREAAGSATLAPPFLSAQPCIVMLALIPFGIGAVAVRLRRRRSPPGR